MRGREANEYSNLASLVSWLGWGSWKPGDERRGESVLVCYELWKDHSREMKFIDPNNTTNLITSTLIQSVNFKHRATLWIQRLDQYSQHWDPGRQRLDLRSLHWDHWDPHSLHLGRRLRWGPRSRHWGQCQR